MKPAQLRELATKIGSGHVPGSLLQWNEIAAALNFKADYLEHIEGQIAEVESCPQMYDYRVWPHEVDHI